MQDLPQMNAEMSWKHILVWELMGKVKPILSLHCQDIMECLDGYSSSGQDIEF